MNQVQPVSIAGIYEICIGVTDALPQIQYWEQFGYCIGEIGELSASVAAELYGVCSKVRSVRLEHQGADHGLIRLMVWEKPKNNGLQMSSMKVKGNRWATTLTADLLNILNHAEDAQSINLPVKYTSPRWEVIYNKERKARPFVGAAVGVREMMLLQPLTRQVFFQRFNYALPNYGKINENAFFKTSQITHMGMIIQDDSKETLLFYEEVLGLIRARDDVETTFESSLAGREIFSLHPGEKFVVTAFDDPRSSKTDFAAARSGRLYILRFPSAIALDDQVDRAIPGCLGMSLYTYRVSSIAEYFHRVKASSAQKITEIVPNEFGEPSFSFIAPDGYFWTLIESAS
ncbi:VOC family protein [Microcoleus sp. herbarium12]|uniref:VOC family protein n=1 Tax=Microcoleus sp. herbarium12 TaxID=3055437 RepID=UPI002FD3E76F